MSVPQIKAISEKHIEGYAAIFSTPDTVGDVMLPGSFDTTLQEWQKRDKCVPMLWQHDVRDPIGFWYDFKLYKKGLYVKGVMLTEELQMARHAKTLLENKCVTGLSIGFKTRDSYFDEKLNRRYLRDIELMEISLVTFPAHHDTEINQRHLDWRKQYDERDDKS